MAIIAKGKIIKVETVAKLLAQQERLVWRMSPLEKGIEVLKGYTDVKEIGTSITTPYCEQLVGEWNQKLVEAGVKVTEMHRCIPTLEDLFLEMTGGETID